MFEQNKSTSNVAKTQYFSTISGVILCFILSQCAFNKRIYQKLNKKLQISLTEQFYSFHKMKPI